MACVDLNPVRAAIADTIESSAHTSIKERISPQLDLAEALRSQTEQQSLIKLTAPLKSLLGFDGVICNGFQRGILLGFDVDLKLVDCTGPISRDDKRDAIDEKKALPILERLNVKPGRWCERGTRFEASY